MTILIAFVIIVAIIVFLYSRASDEKTDRYFGKEPTYNKEEQKILNYYKNLHKPVPKDTRLPETMRDGFELKDIVLTASQILLFLHECPNNKVCKSMSHL